MLNSSTWIFSWIASHWRTNALVAGAFGIAAVCKRCLETDETRARRADHNRKKELQRLANDIATYGRDVHQRYPTGDVVVGEHDLAKQLRKRPDVIAKALHILLGEGRVQKTPLRGYWKLNI